MSGEKTPRCQYTWDRINDHANCCYREVWGDRDRCIWHATGEDFDKKPIEELQQQRESETNRSLNQGDTSDRPGELLDGAQLAGTELVGLLFEQCFLRDADLTDANLGGADLTDADLGHADLTDANLGGADLTGADLWDADLTNAHLWGTDFTDAHLGAADLTNAYLWADDLTNAHLPGADLTGADLRDADLTGAHLGDADLNLGGADLTDANLRGADLTDSSLEDAILSRTNLQDSTISKVNLSSTTVSDLILNAETHVDGLYASPDSWDELAQGYHDLKTQFSGQGLDEKARTVFFLERRARTREAWANRDFMTVLGAILSRYLTGYGVRVLYVLAWSFLILAATTGWYELVGGSGTWNGGSLFYSVVTFVTSPPHPPPIQGGITGTLTSAIILFETYFGTVLIILLGYVLSNRDQV